MITIILVHVTSLNLVAAEVCSLLSGPTLLLMHRTTKAEQVGVLY